ncbi:hypothetical protein IV40_GL001545 [Lactobacillus selangorensis]|uniref:DUF4767 domain-containing protein n=1 Tax=Lactobacillus selangorensis TaxID=81857 RepID=A0A0R2G0A4_9LACO|nr:hypothetical protein IV40_GL001545 [Lactobacillus selangorensis]
MQMKKASGLLLLAVLGMVLSGCQNNTGKSASSESASTAATKVTPSVSKQDYRLKWNTKKAAQLAAYMVQFGKNMNQNYTQVKQGTTASWFNASLKKMAQENRAIEVGGKVEKTKWFPAQNLGSKARTNVVAAYADDDAHILYLFVVNHAQAARVLVSQQAVNDKGRLVMKETANTAIKGAFNSILAGQNVSSDAETSASASSSISSSAAPKDAAAGDAPTVNFPSRFEGTWYGYEQGSDVLKTVTISGAKLTEDGTTITLHDVSDQTFGSRHGDC